jgi:DNA-binding GntR family transcriptional regulator
VVKVRQGIFGGAYIREVDFDKVVDQIGNSLRMINVTFRQLADVRAALEEIVLSRFLPQKITHQDIMRLQDTIQSAEESFKARQLKKRLKDNFEFHSMLVKLSGNPMLILMHRLVVDLSIAFFENVKASSAMAEETIAYHKKIVELLKRQKYGEAAKICSEHIQVVSSRIMEKSKQQSLLEIANSPLSHER